MKDWTGNRNAPRKKQNWSSMSAVKCFASLTLPYHVQMHQEHFKNIPSWVEIATFDISTEYCLGALGVIYQEWEYCPFATENNPNCWVSKWSALEHMQGNSKTEILLKTVCWDMLMHPVPSSYSEMSTNFVAAFVGKGGNKAENVSSHEITAKICAYLFWKPKRALTQKETVSENTYLESYSPNVCDLFFLCWWIKWD